MLVKLTAVPSINVDWNEDDDDRDQNEMTIARLAAGRASGVGVVSGALLQTVSDIVRRALQKLSADQGVLQKTFEVTGCTSVNELLRSCQIYLRLEQLEVRALVRRRTAHSSTLTHAFLLSRAARWQFHECQPTRGYGGYRGDGSSLHLHQWQRPRDHDELPLQAHRGQHR